MKYPQILTLLLQLYCIKTVSILQILGGHARVRIRRANLPLSPLDLGGARHRVSGQQICANSYSSHVLYDLDLVCTEIYASCFLRLLAKGTSKLWEVGQRSSIFLPDALRISACGHERIDIVTLHWDPEDASCTAPPKSAADACEDVDGNDCGPSRGRAFPVLEVETSTHLAQVYYHKHLHNN